MEPKTDSGTGSVFPKTEDHNTRFIDAIPDPIVIFNAKGEILDCNELFIKSLRISKGKEKTLKGNVFDFIAKRDLDRTRLDLESAIRVGPVGGMIYTITRADGSEFPAEISVKVSKQDGNLLVVGIFKDVTERINAETLLKESEQKYRELVEPNIIGIISANMESITEANDAFLKIVGYSRQDLEEGKMRWRKMTPPEYAPSDDKGLKELLEHGKCEPFEKEYYKKDGSRVPILIGRSLIKRSPLEWVCFVMDITERKKAEDALKESEEKYRELVENANSIIFKWDATGKILSMNEYGLNFFSFSLEEVLGKSVFETFVPKRESTGRDLTLLIDKILTDHQYVDNINENVKKNGERIWIHWTNKPMVDAKGKLAILSVGDDVTQRKKMEDELKNYSECLQLLVTEKTKELQDAQRLAIIGETATMVGHDLRNPLQSIINTMYILNKKIKEMPLSSVRDELTSSYERIERNANYMNKIVSDLLDYSRPMVPESTVTNLQRLIDETLADIKIPDNVAITLLFDRTLKVMVDSQLIKRAFTNLITNAIQAMPDGGALTITAEDTDKGIYMKFTDTGKGIPADVMKNFFKPFVTNKAKGMGMGLVIVKRIIDAHKGSIDVESEVGKGTTFAITIPLKQQL
jgi:PAS domain S-box-containing protein